MLVTGDRDQLFSMDVVEETVRLIPDCTLVVYEGRANVKAATNKRVPRDVLAFVNRKQS